MTKGMEMQNKSIPSENKKSWFGWRSSYDLDKNERGADETQSMGFQSKDPIISIQFPEKSSKEKEAMGSAVAPQGGHGGHGISVEHPTSYSDTLMHLLKGNVGSGIFAMGDAVKNAGIAVAPGMILFLGLICVHSMHLLLIASKKMTETLKLESSPDFAQTVELCFATGPLSLRKIAPYTKKLVNLFLCVTQLGFCCVYFVFISSNIKQVVDYYGFEMDVHLHMAIILLPILLSCLIRNLKYLAPFSAIANILMLVGISITLYYTSVDLPPISTRKYVAEWHQMPLFFGTALYAFEGIGLVLPLQNEMKKPNQFSRPFGVLNIGMTIVTALYFTVGFLAYLKYGENVQGSVTLNLPENEILAQSVKVIIPLGILLTYALQFYIPVDIMWPAVNNSLGPFKFPVFAELSFRSLLVLLTFILAEAIPYLGLFISLVGAVSSTALALIIPPILDMVTSWSVSEAKPWSTCKNVFILAIGILGCVTGTYESIDAIVKAFMNQE